MRDWVTVLEFSPASEDEPFQLADVETLVERLREWQPVGLFNPLRYALQLHLSAEDGGGALQQALVLHAGAVKAASRRSPCLTRIEILTLAEFERGWADQAPDGRGWDHPELDALQAADAHTVLDIVQAANAQPVADPQPGAETRSPAKACRSLSDQVSWASSAMARASSARELIQVLVEFVVSAGGSVCTAAALTRGNTAVDLWLGQGEPLYATADSVSVARLIIEQWLPGLVTDARAILIGMQRTPADESHSPPA